MGKIPRAHPEPEVTFFIESREESATAESRGESRGQFLLNQLGGGDVLSALAQVRGRVSIAISLKELAVDSALIDFLREYNTVGIPIDIWPNMEDQDGYWMHRGNARTAYTAVLEMIDRLATHSVDFQNIGLDFEFPIQILKGGFQLREFLRQKPWRFSESDSQIYIAELITRILGETPHGVRSYEVPILGDSMTNGANLARKLLGMPKPPQRPNVLPDERFKRVGLVYTSVKPRFMGGSPEQFVRNYSTPMRRVPALGIVSATDVNPGRNLGSKSVKFLTEAELQRDVAAALAVSPGEFYVFALNGLPVIERTRAAIEAAYADFTG